MTCADGLCWADEVLNTTDNALGACGLLKMTEITRSRQPDSGYALVAGGCALFQSFSITHSTLYVILLILYPWFFNKC
jgi:hypothetical protein